MNATSGTPSAPGTEPSYGGRTLDDAGPPDGELPWCGGRLPGGAGAPNGETPPFGGKASYGEELSGGAAGGDGTGHG
ncbi:hypothetical protein [Streptomyces sp. NPDC005141]